MSRLVEVLIPDIGDDGEVDVIEVLVNEGDTVEVEQSLITLESDKASMEVPSSHAGVVKKLRLKVGDKASEGTVILELEEADAAAATDKDEAADSAPEQPAATSESAAAASTASTTGETVTVVVPDIGDDGEVDVIEVLVSPGDTVELEQSLITLESDKASMEVPSSHAGTVKELLVQVGDKVSQGSEILLLEAATQEAAADEAQPAEPSTPAKTAAGAATAATTSQAEQQAQSKIIGSESGRMASEPPARVSPTEAFAVADVPATSLPHASPSVRAFARELGVDLNLVEGTARKGRITADDVKLFVKTRLAEPAAGGPTAGAGAQLGGLELLPWPKVDFERFGEIETQPLTRIKKISGANLHRNWVMIPHVTNNDEADITELEALRKQLNNEYKKEGVRVTMLAFLIKACVAALKKFPEFNSSLDGDNLVLKKYYNIGFAADTPHGLVVPVLKDADKKGVIEIAQEMSDLAAQARDGKLGAAQMQGGCFTISSLGGIGGTDFTPIINAPEVAILGVSRSKVQPVWDGKEFEPRLMLPLSLSYDHRVIDGAAAARFNAYLAQLLADFRRIIL
ncbi:MAG TPA: dihydrolipoyllysine-residue acetyltransferase [Paenalcaligenes sp.]|nr:dihydrolipoyllysine-residue acetyltransferase [Paenalcaligenes sp.]